MAKTPPIGLRNAILSGEIAEVEEALRNGADVNAEIDDVAPLTFAIQNGEEDVALHLIQAGADLSLDPLPIVSEEREPVKNSELNPLYIPILLILWLFEKSSWDAACASILSSKLWPRFLGPFLNSVSAQTTFGFTMRGHVIDLCSALIKGNLSAGLWFPARFMPIYTLMFLWAWTEKSAGSDLDSLSGFRRLFQHCFLVGKWTMLAFALEIFQHVLYVFANSTYFLLQGERANGGSQALQAILKYPGSSHKVASAIIDARVLSREYIICSIQEARLSPDYLVVPCIWHWALRNGYTQIVSKLLELGFPPTELFYVRELSPIGWSAVLGHVGLCECLIAALDPTDLSAIEQIDRAFALSIIPGDSHRHGGRQKEISQIQSILLARLTDVNVRGHDKRTVLSYAVSSDDLTLVSHLLERGADVTLEDMKGRPPLSYLTNGENCLSICDRLVSAGADLDHEDDDGNTIMLRHAAMSSTRALRVLLTKGADPNRVDSIGRTPLHKIASRYPCDLGSIETLIEQGANVNATYTQQRQDRSFAVSVIGVAVRYAGDSLGVMKALLSAGASPNGLDEEGQPVIVTVCHHRRRIDGNSKGLEMVQVLIEAGADLHYRDEFDENLLHHASRRYSNNYLALKTLLIQGVDVNAKNIFGCTPAHIAATAGNPRVMAMLLLQAGAHQVYDLSDKCERLPFHYAVLSPETVRLLLHYHSTGEISSDRYWGVEEQREESLAALGHATVDKIWHEISRDRYQKAHPNEIIDDVSYPLPWMRGRCNAQDKYGNTPLHYAALAGNVEVVNQYVAMPDVDPAVRNNDGETPFDFSLENRDCALVLRDRLLELGLGVSDTSGNTPMKSKSKSRRAADKFVEALGESRDYGLYPLDGQIRRMLKWQKEVLRQGVQSDVQEG